MKAPAASRNVGAPGADKGEAFGTLFLIPRG